MLIEPFRTQLIETAVSVGVYVIARSVIKWLIRIKVGGSADKAHEEREVWRMLNLLLVLVLTVVIGAVWGMKQSEILVFATSVITVLGVAFFAEMSILSNITACLVLFFQHPVKIGDRVRVHDGQREIEGALVDITYFFAFIRTNDGTHVSIPNAVLLKNSFTIIDRTGD